jgi:hypothetical protein
LSILSSNSLSTSIKQEIDSKQKPKPHRKRLIKFNDEYLQEINKKKENYFKIMNFGDAKYNNSRKRMKISSIIKQKKAKLEEDQMDSL